MKANEFFNSILKCGNFSFKPTIKFQDKEAELEYQVNINDEKTVMIMLGENEIIKDSISVIRKGSDFSVKRTILNKGEKLLKLKELAVYFRGIDFCKKPKDDFFYHTENSRIYENLTFPIDYKRTSDDAKNSEFDVQAGNRWADPGVIQERIGASPYQAFPAVLISNYESNYGIVHGTLSQDVFFHNYLVRHGDKIEFDVFSSFKGISYREVKPQEILIDEWYLGETDKSYDIEQIFKNYTNVLRKKLPNNYGSTYINRDNMVWGSWNDGIWREVTDDLLVAESKALKKYFPTVRWIQVDDGYCTTARTIKPVAHGLGVPYEGDEGVDKIKFPFGLKHATDEIREIGLRPAIWIGGFCPHFTKIYSEHPEWFIDYSYRVGTSSPLDVSQPEVRDYMEKALDTLVVKYGFDGVKHDFWSYAFEDSHDMYKYKDKSGYEYRKWWLVEMRKRISKDGYFQTGCDVAMGNPFLGEFFTNYRYGVDVGSGQWKCFTACFLWGSACFALHTGDLIVPNSDAIGPLKGLPFNEFMTWTNFVLISRSGVELAGRFSKEENVNDERFKVIKKAVCNPNNGQDVYFAKFDYRKSGYNTPEIMYLKTSLFSSEESEVLPVRTVALFNIGEKSKEIEFRYEDLGLESGKYIITDVWSGKRLLYKDGIKVKLNKHSSKMFTISKKTKFAIIDADIRLKEVKKQDKSIIAETDYKSIANITLLGIPKKTLFNDKEIKFTFNNRVLTTEIMGKGKLEIIF